MKVRKFIHTMGDYEQYMQSLLAQCSPSLQSYFRKSKTRRGIFSGSTHRTETTSTGNGRR